VWAVRVVAFLAGLALAVSVLLSAIRTVVVPRGIANRLTRAVFVLMRRVFWLRANRTKTWEARDHVMASYAPVTLVLLPGVWVLLVLIAFTPMYWAIGVDAWADAIAHSGSALLTLGFASQKTLAVSVLSFVEATLGLGLVALLISFLPTIYSQFSKRESMVALLETRAGSPPSPAGWLERAQRIEWLGRTDDLWGDWESWFIDIEESHPSYPALVFFRSPQPDRSWVTAAGCALDTAAIRASTVDLPRTYQAELMIRSGYLALRRIAAYYDLPFDPDPAPDAPISVAREEFDAVYDRLAGAGIPLKADRDRCWRDFAGWRVNYDAALLGLAGLVMAPVAPWSSDRSATYRRPRVFHGRRSR
jgi:hypothetical protein